MGIFAYDDAYNDILENDLYERGIKAGITYVGNCDEVCRLYEPYAPTFDEMVIIGIKFLDSRSNDKEFLLVSEE